MGNSWAQWLHKIQNSDLATRRKWLYIMSGATMIVVVGLWLWYASATLRPEETAAASLEKSEQPSAFAVLKSGTQILWQRVKEFLGRKEMLEPETNK